MSTTVDARPASSLAGSLLPLLAAVAVVFLITGVALPALPLHVHQRLGFGTFVVGLVAGAQFTASLVSRIWAGLYSDTRGAKRAVIAGLIMATAAGLLYLSSLLVIATPVLSVAILILGRAVLGGAESFIITGAQSWGLAVANSGSAGKVISWMGTAMYVALAVGAPLGTMLFGRYGFAAIGLATTIVPIATLALVLPLRGVEPKPQAKRPFAAVAKAVWLPGLALSFGSLGFGAMTSFAILLFVDRGWQPAWASFTAFALAFIMARLVLGHLADRIGGAKVALVFVLVEAVGQCLIWAAPSAWLGFVGAVLTGFGFSLVYPALGLEAVRRAPPESRGLAMGVYTAFLDVSMGILSPLLGLIGSIAGLGAVFLSSFILLLCTVPLAVWLLIHPISPNRQGENHD
ncbi:arabinose transporter [Mesorhizobium sp. INR15]|uniref:arabinose transporter n=1 Tax=Mesorhizobium sp. INR15 TaxID=2654248 RepID=UPI001896A3BE|nr:arabinose transporter [Mesorhizobium sp. INR15]QPC91823.1 MFS transporter [Mesorhizobium sp. INR15]